ncbi:hypothetical protein BZL54_32690 [Burkholderia ubonensis subsp. mesacidophila]|uniref:Aminotransferase class V domain-containing protein n=1 Tax=Burkholderia ubonensis subsp. mesacidophila TaxID=265293 RepID=A0A2A4ESP5_9BURK|nr:hypothetical protein BZL54_32690 [Burkholderia ubonensis subsp. mesacidophila]
MCSDGMPARRPASRARARAAAGTACARSARRVRRARGVRMAELGHGNIRAVTHCHHSAHDIDRTFAIVREILSSAS